MCGLCGIVRWPADRPEARLRHEVAGMTKVLAHRGPDGEGVWVDASAGVALGHRRLAVIDPSAAGHQPMASPCGRYVVVFNGELYDFEALRETVEVAGTRVSGRSDTAVLVAALSAWGVDGSLARFDGMFALAIWDRRERRLHLVRDPFGKKPLYVRDVGSSVWFGSELKALRAHPEYERTIDREALAQHLRFSFIAAPRSIDLGTEKLCAGEHRCFEARGGESRRFFDWRARAEAAARDPFRGSRAEALDALEQGVTEAVRRRLVADVPLGALLSGGVDSALVAATAQQQQSAPLETFHVGFSEAGFDERADAAAVAKRLGTRHETWVLGPEEARARIPALPWLFDEPFGDTAQLGMALLCEATRREVTVALSGDGGDEVFLGYPRTLRCARRGRWLARVPARWREVLGQAAERTGPRRERLAMGVSAGGPDALFVTAASRHPANVSLVRGVRGPVETGQPWPGIADPLARLRALDLGGRLPESMLVKVDRASMGHGLEVRSPLLDRGLVDFALRLPTHWLVRSGRGKWPLRQLLARHLPKAWTERPKRGFALPIGAWLRGPLRGWADDLLAPAALRQQGLLEADAVGQIWTLHCSGRVDRTRLVWNLVGFQAWLAQQA
ncbi:MAG: asparagine synthase (glutamine-hydrolyzing) [Myxococcota bacterium]